MSRLIQRGSGPVRAWHMLPIRPGRLDSVLTPAEAPLAVTDPGEVLTSACAQAEETLHQARQQADAILRRAQEEAEQLREHALQEGHAEGEARGLEALAAERERLAVLVERLPEAYQRFCNNQVPTLAELVTVAAERLLLEQLTLEPERVVTIVREALAQLTVSSQITIHLHPDDVEIARDHPKLQEARQAATITFQPDPTVDRGGCWIRSEQGEVDATLAGRLARLSHTMSDG